MSDCTIIAHGIVFMSICVPAEYTRDQVEQAANALMPTGISSRWQISEETHFSGGQTNPCECERGPAYQHHLLNC